MTIKLILLILLGVAVLSMIVFTIITVLEQCNGGTNDDNWFDP